MQNRRATTSLCVRILLAGAALALVSACTEPVATDYHEKYAVTPYPTIAVLGVHVAGGRLAFADDEEARLNALVAGYLDRGHAPITLTALRPARSGGGVPAGVAAVRARLIAGGVPPHDIAVKFADQGSPDIVTLSYERYEVLLPTCGDWTSSPLYEPYNGESSNFGCALQRDVGLMVADPADLVRQRTPAPPDAHNAARVIQRYQAGTPTGAVPNPAQAFGASSAPSQP